MADCGSRTSRGSVVLSAEPKEPPNRNGGAKKQALTAVSAAFFASKDLSPVAEAVRRDWEAVPHSRRIAAARRKNTAPRARTGGGHRPPGGRLSRHSKDFISRRGGKMRAERSSRVYQRRGACALWPLRLLRAEAIGGRPPAETAPVWRSRGQKAGTVWRESPVRVRKFSASGAIAPDAFFRPNE